MTRARSLSRLANSQAFTVDSDLDVGINSTSPSSKLDVGGDIIVSGVVTATSFIGDVTGDVTGNATGLTGNPSISVTDITATGNVSIAGTLTYEDVTSVDSVGIITAQSGIDVTGGDINIGTATTITDGGLNVTGVVTATSFSGDGSSVTNVNATTLDTIDSGSFLRSDAADTKTSGNLTFNDNIQAQFGTDGDLVINHNGSHSIMLNGGTGNLSIQSSAGEVQLAKGGTFEHMLRAIPDAAVELYYDNAKKFETTGGGIQVTGVVTATSFSGDGSTLTGVESGVADFVASGNISNGDTVVLNSDGTVSIATTSGSEFIGVAGTSTFHNGDTNDIAATYDSTTNKVVIIYRNIGDGYGIVGTVSGKSISFGNPSSSFETSSLQDISVTYDSTNERVIVAYRDNTDGRGKVVVGKIRGTSIAFVSGNITFNTSTTTDISAVYDSSNQKVVIAYDDGGNLNYGTAIVGTVSGDTISFGTPVVFESANVNNISATYDSANQKVVIAYEDTGNLNYGTAVVGTVSGTSISFGTPTVFESADTTWISATYDSTNQKVVIAYRDVTNSSYGTAVVGTVSGTSISFGTPVVFESASTNNISATYDSANQKVVIAYKDLGNSNYGTITTGTVSGTSISFGTPVVFNSGSTTNISAIYDSVNQKVVIPYEDDGFASYGIASVVTTVDFATNLNPENYIGIAAEAISDTATGKITIAGGVNSGQTGLTTGQTYYVQEDGTLNTIDTTGVVAGTSISATEILVR